MKREKKLNKVLKMKLFEGTKEFTFLLEHQELVTWKICEGGKS